MPAASTTLRMLAVSVIASLTVTGCQTFEDAGRRHGPLGTRQRPRRPARPGLELTYSADYQLPGGQRAAIVQAQDPARSAYTYPGGRLTVTPEAITRCTTAGARPECTLIAPPTPGSKPTVTCFGEANQQGLVTPPVVVGLLTAAALDPQAVIKQSDTTVAGHHAACVDGAELAGDFTACVTTEGVLGSFTGPVDGKPMELALSSYSATVDGARSTRPPAPASSTAAPAARDRVPTGRSAPRAIERGDRAAARRPRGRRYPQRPSRVRRWRGGGQSCASIASCQSRTGTPVRAGGGDRRPPRCSRRSTWRAGSR